MTELDDAELDRRLALNAEQADAEVSSLIAAAEGEGLTELDISGYCVSDLTPVATLTGLKILNCSGTQISDLTPVAALTVLQTLDCSDTQISDLTPLAGLTGLEVLSCSSTQIIDLTPVAALRGLQTLNCFDTKISDLTPVAALKGLHVLSCSDTEISDLTPLVALTDLQVLNCSDTRIGDLTPLAALTDLQTLHCSGTLINDLIPLAALTGLKELYCSRTQIGDLTPLAALTGLEALYCASTQIGDLTPLAALTGLEALHCSRTQIGDLNPLAELTALQSLDCSGTQIGDLIPLAALTDLKTLDCSHTLIGDLTALAALTDLQNLECSHTQVGDLTPLTTLKGLKWLDVSANRLNGWPKALFDLPAFEHLTAVGTHMREVPGEVLSQSYGDDCLDRLRAHFDDLAEGSTPIARIKIIVLGNGQVGKTQLRRWLLNPSESESVFDASVPSTHGIEVLRGPIRLPANAMGKATIDASLWDFGGQDIYHGTHGLFMKTRAIFVLCWSAEQEDSHKQELGGMVFQNQPMAYWIDYVRQLAGTDNPILIVQTQCDAAAAEHPQRHAGLDLDAFDSKRVLQFSAKNGRGGAALREAIGEAAQWIDERDGVAVIGKGRLAVLNQLEAWRSEDAIRPAEHRRHKLLTQTEFATLCRDSCGISAPQYLLDFLHNAGVVYYRQGLFDDRIVLDLNWVLDAIYTAFDRQVCYPILKRNGGRFTGDLIGHLAWQGYSYDERMLFLSMMESCGIVFAYDQDHGRSERTEYVAPELLPDRVLIGSQFAGRWRDETATVSRDLRFALLHQGLIRQILARIGRQARLNAIYWRTGVLFFEQHRRATARIEAVMDARGWGGYIRIECQDGQAETLLGLLIEEVVSIAAEMGLAPDAVPERLRRGEPDAQGESQVAPVTPAVFPRPETQWYVSYAWGDATPEGAARDRHIEALCQAAEMRGVHIIRDKTANGNGDSIRRFMEEISRGDRVIIILSGKYLESAYCMFELYKTWERHGADRERFAKVVRWYVLPCAKIGKMAERGAVAARWEAEVAKAEPYLKNLGPGDLRDWHMTRQFALSVGEILYAVKDTISPPDWDGFLEYAFEDGD